MPPHSQIVVCVVVVAIRLGFAAVSVQVAIKVEVVAWEGKISEFSVNCLGPPRRPPLLRPPRQNSRYAHRHARLRHPLTFVGLQRHRHIVVEIVHLSQLSGRLSGLALESRRAQNRVFQNTVSHANFPFPNRVQYT